MDDKDAVEFRSRGAWGAWLSRNHDKEGEIWTIMYKKCTGKGGLTLAEAVEEAICFGWIDSRMKNLDSERWVLRFSPRKPDSPWSKINKDRARAMIKEGRMQPPGLAAVERAKRNGRWRDAYTMRKGTPMPDDLREALGRDERALRNFNGSANSYRNAYINYVTDAKRPETRRKRIDIVVRNSLAKKKPGIEGP